jgi:hypothetical protein
MPAVAPGHREGLGDVRWPPRDADQAGDSNDSKQGRQLPRVATSSFWWPHLISRNSIAAAATDGIATSESRRNSSDAKVDDEDSWQAEALVAATHARTTPSYRQPRWPPRA